MTFIHSPWEVGYPTLLLLASINYIYKGHVGYK
jgi:hypothetical protein